MDNRMIFKYKFNEIHVKQQYYEYHFNYDNIFEYRTVKRHIEENKLKNDKLLNFLMYYVIQKIVFNKKVI